MDDDKKIFDKNVQILETDKVGQVLHDMLGSEGNVSKSSNEGLVAGGTTIHPKLKKRILKGDYIELGLLAPRSKINVESNGEGHCP